jgi:four helix bundle protein
MKNNPLKDKSYQFAIRIVKLSQFLQQEKKEFVLSALIREAEFAQSKADFANKMSISLKEANETEYWLSLLKDTGYISENQFISLQSDCRELIAMLVSTVKTSKS